MILLASNKIKKNGRLVNKEMNNKVYQEKTKVINCIYELKKVVPSLPRIEVKITHNGEGEDKYLLGLGRLNKNQIWIAERCLNSPSLYQVVAHEVIHAVTGFGHDENCPLMKSTVTKILSKEEVNQIFKTYFK